MRSIRLIWLIPIIAVLCTAGGAWAAIMATAEIPTTVTIIGDEGLEVYEDSKLTNPLEELSFTAHSKHGDPCKTEHQKYYVLNTTNSELWISSWCEGIEGIPGAIYIYDDHKNPCPAGEAISVKSQFEFVADTPSGEYHLTIHLEGID